MLWSTKTVGSDEMVVLSRGLANLSEQLKKTSNNNPKFVFCSTVPCRAVGSPHSSVSPSHPQAFVHKVLPSMQTDLIVSAVVILKPCVHTTRFSERCFFIAYRNECIFTIDPATARDLDDALSCKQLPDGKLLSDSHDDDDDNDDVVDVF